MFLAIRPYSLNGDTIMLVTPRGDGAVQTMFSNGGVAYEQTTWEDNSISWWNGSYSHYQLNSNDKVYYYVAIG